MYMPKSAVVHENCFRCQYKTSVVKCRENSIPRSLWATAAQSDRVLIGNFASLFYVAVAGVPASSPLLTYQFTYLNFLPRGKETKDKRKSFQLRIWCSFVAANISNASVESAFIRHEVHHICCIPLWYSQLFFPHTHRGANQHDWLRPIRLWINTD